MIDRILKPLQDFLRLEAAGGLMLLVAAVFALLIANSPLAVWYSSVFETRLVVGVAPLQLGKPLLLWINDGLMAVFFFLVGMELKREIVEGHLSSLRAASLPAFAALGGMVIPALFYIFFTRTDTFAIRGWAIPTATDIAFALGVLALLGNRVPTALKAFLLSVAIFDDLGAIVIIAFVFTERLSAVAIGVAWLMIGGLALMNRLGVMRPAAYLLLGIPLWIAVLKSGVHATLAGVVLAMFIPLRVRGPGSDDPGASPLRRLEKLLHPWVAFGVLPLFALANAGVSITNISLRDALQPVPLGIIAGLFLGKQIGIMASCWIATKLRLATLPEAVGWPQLYGVALLCGIGFTMSLFMATLAFGGNDPFNGLERLGILIGTALSGVAGVLILRATLDRGRKPGTAASPRTP
jgi:NhaA family Na+:H+ antiporter